MSDEVEIGKIVQLSEHRQATPLHQDLSQLCTPKWYYIGSLVLMAILVGGSLYFMREKVKLAK